MQIDTHLCVSKFYLNQKGDKCNYAKKIVAQFEITYKSQIIDFK